MPVPGEERPCCADGFLLRRRLPAAPGHRSVGPSRKPWGCR
jgi:hypothetical protein